MRYAPIAILGCVVALAGCGSTDGPDREHRKPPEAAWHPASAMLTKYITNTDGSLTRVQMMTGLHRDFSAADADHSGCLDTDETRAINDQRYATDKSTYSPLVDFKGKGCIDFDEFAATPLSLFDTLDRDNNGVLTAKELNPIAPRGPGPGGGRYGPPPDSGGGPRGGPPGGGTP